MKRRIATYSIILLFCFALFALFSQNQAQATSDIIPHVNINPGESVGQTFTSLHRGLNEIGVTVSAQNNESGNLKLLLYHNNSQQPPVFSKDYSINVSSAEFLSLIFEAQKDSYLEDYFLELNWSGSGPISFQTNPSESYTQGSLYINSYSAQAQLDFNLEYDRVQLSLGLGLVVLQWLWQLFLTALILLLPGWAILSIAWPGWEDYDLLIKLTLAFGVSYALYPTLFLLTDFIDFHPGEVFFVWVVMGLSAISLFIHYRPDLRVKDISASKLLCNFRLRSENWLNLATVVVLSLIFFVKFWAIRTLDTPMWGDSYQHTMITQLMMNNGGMFDSWQPYVPYETFTVHFGFHSLATVFAWISNLSASQTVLWVGQISNALAALSLYPIAFKVSGKRKWAGVIAITFAGLILRYPNYYVNWGRYAQLSGQVLLPLVGFLLVEVLFSKETNISQLAIVSILLGGMALSYYRMPFFLAIWIPLLIGEMILWLRRDGNKFSTLLLRGMLILLGMVVLLIPLFSRISGGALAQSVGSMHSPGLQQALSNFLNNLNSTQYYYSKPLIVLTVISVVAGILAKQWRVLAIMLGMVLIHSYVLGTMVDLPFSNFIDAFSIQLMTYIGLGVIISYGFALVAENLDPVHPSIAAFLLITLSVFFAFQAKNVTDKTYEIVTRPDLRAFQWIRENTALDDLFLVNGFTIYDNTSGVGSDGGWWISLLTERRNTMPPQYAVLNERPEDPGYTKWTVDAINHFETYSPPSEEGLEAMCDWEVDYIYIGQRQGSVNDPTPMLRWQEWEETSAFSLVYAKDLVRIYQIDPSYCETRR